MNRINFLKKAMLATGSIIAGNQISLSAAGVSLWHLPYAANGRRPDG